VRSWVTKPAPDIFATALDNLPGVAAEEVIFVGDAPYDMEAANKCGIAGRGALRQNRGRLSLERRRDCDL
jgi:membrane protein